MITVSICINNNAIFTCSARNALINKNGKTKYITDADDIIWHNPANGAIELAKLMLGTIHPEMD